MSAASFKLLVCLGALSVPTLAQAECYTTVSEVKANLVQTRWRETSENDGKPMTISIKDGVSGLIFSAQKAGAPWLNGNVSVCRSGRTTDITLNNSKATSNVPMITRLGLPPTLSAPIVGNRIKLAGGGWSGTFVGQ